jgi:hypothetical protein
MNIAALTAAYAPPTPNLAKQAQSFETMAISQMLAPAGRKQEFRETLRQLDLLAAANRTLLDRSIGIQSQVLGIIACAARGGAFTLSARA